MSDWITLNDHVWTPERITAEVANRAKSREAELGHLEIILPPFEVKKGISQPLGDSSFNTDLFNHLQALNEAPRLEMATLLAPPPMAQSSWWGDFRQRIRRQFHDLVLFYVNRAAGQQNQFNQEMTAALNELARGMQAQQKGSQQPRVELSGPKEQREEA